MTWRQEAASIIAAAVKDLTEDTTLHERKRVVDAARPGWVYMSWPKKAWQAARRDYLVRYGYRPRTKKQSERARAVVEDLPLFNGGRK